MALTFHTLCVGPLDVNCYIAGCETHKVCAVIDPGDASGRILDKVSSLGWKVEKIINTHGHYDHVGANGKVKDQTSAPIYIHTEEATVLNHPDMADMAAYFGLGVSPEPDQFIEDGDTIEICPCSSFQVVHTPGHSPGSVCLLSDNTLVTGDTLFRYSIGRTDLPGGDHTAMGRSLKERLLPLPDELAVLPGHGDPSRMGEEKKLNPFLVGSF